MNANNNTASIPRFSYNTPVGSFSTWEDAAIACERCDLDPCNCIEIVKEA